MHFCKEILTLQHVRIWNLEQKLLPHIQDPLIPQLLLNTWLLAAAVLGAEHMCPGPHNQAVTCKTYIFFKDFIYLFIHERHTQRERGAETQAEEEAGSMQGAQRGTWSWVSRITPWIEGSAKPLSYPGCPTLAIFKKQFVMCIYKLYLYFPFLDVCRMVNVFP